MGLPSICFMVIELPEPVLLALWLLNEIRLSVMLILRLLYLFHSVGNLSIYLFSTASSPSIAPPSPATMKGRLPVVAYRSIMKGEESTCMVCLGEFEERDELRELGNCSHAFHMVCMDQWIDMGHATCPLCRVQLLPMEKRMNGRGLLKLFPKICSRMTQVLT